MKIKAIKSYEFSKIKQQFSNIKSNTTFTKVFWRNIYCTSINYLLH